MLKQENTPRLETRSNSSCENFNTMTWRMYSGFTAIWRSTLFCRGFRCARWMRPGASVAHTILPEYEKKIAYRYAIVERTNGDRLCVAERHRRRKMLRRPRLRPAQDWRKGYMSEACRAVLQRAEGGGVPFSHRHARCEQPGERRGHEGDRHNTDIPRRAVVTQEF